MFLQSPFPVWHWIRTDQKNWVEGAGKQWGLFSEGSRAKPGSKHTCDGRFQLVLTFLHSVSWLLALLTSRTPAPRTRPLAAKKEQSLHKRNCFLQTRPPAWLHGPTSTAPYALFSPSSCELQLVYLLQSFGGRSPALTAGLFVCK